MKSRSLLLFFLFLSAGTMAQNFSNKGKEFWLPYAGHIDNTTSRMALYISATENTSGEVQLDNKTIPFTVTANQTTTVQISPTTYNVYNSQSDGTGIGKGIRVIAQTPIVLYAHILNAARSGSTLVLPVNVLGKEYVSLNAFQTSNQGRSQITVVATENNTNIELNLLRASSGTPSRPANTPYQITLNKGDVYQVQSTQDLTGSTIKSVSTNSSSCKPIAVFTGSTWTAFDCAGASGGDNLYQQVFPSNAWGRNYITAPFANRQSDVYRIIVRDPTTLVTLNGSLLNTSSLINNTYYEFKNSIPNVIVADKSILVVQYMTSQTCDTRNPANCGSNCPYPGDPEMITINPLEQTINNVSVVSARNDLTPPNTNIRVHYLNILMKTSDIGSLKIDNAAPKANWVPIPNSSYSYLQEDVTASTAINPSHNIKADSGFIALAYGMGNVESYGYNAGTNVKDLLAPIFQNPYGRLDFATTCVGNKFNFSVPLTYMPTTITWDFGGSTKLNPNTNIGPVTPVPDSTPVVNGKQLYYFSPSNGPSTKDFIYTATGNDTIRLFATNPSPDGCNSSNAEYLIPVVVNPAPKARFTVPANYCIGAPIPFSDASTDLGTGEVVSGLWNWGDGTTDSLKNPLHTFNTEGTFTIRYRPITNYGCSGDTTIALVITGRPIANYTLKDSTCLNKTLTFTDGSTITSGTMVKWYWNYGDGTSEIVTANTARTKSFTATGTYNIQLEVENSSGCKSMPFSSTIVIRPIPVPNFNLPIVCLPEGSARFFDSTTIADGSGNFTYRWDFGDNAGIDSIKNPIYTYNSTGPFSVSLIVTSPFGCIDSTRKTLSSIYPQAKAAFQVFSENCLRDSSFFTDQTDGKGSNIAGWRWSFGNTKTDTIQNPVHLYATAGTFNVQLFAITDKGCYSDTLIIPVTVNPLPTANFTLMTPYCETRALSFVDQSVANAGTLANWKWNFGDGDTKDVNTGAAFQKTYTAWGNYTIELQVTSSKGCKSDTLKRVQAIHPLPKPGFILPEICVSDGAADLLDTSKIADGSAAAFQWQWRIDKGKLFNAQPTFINSNVKDAKLLVNKSDFYMTTLVITSNNGCKDSIASELTVNGSIPKAAFTVINDAGLCGNDSVRIINTSTVDFGSVTKLQIQWENGNPAGAITNDDSPTPLKGYANRYAIFQAPATKNYTVKLTAYSGNAAACQSAFTQTITLNRSPKVSFSPPQSICNDAAIQAISPAATTFPGIPGVPVYSGTGIVDPVNGLFNPAVSGPGTFAIKYLHVSDKGCRDSASQNITIHPSPIAQWGFGNPSCEKNILVFTDSSLPRVGKIVQRNWNMGDGKIQTFTAAGNFNHTYAIEGNYEASLQVITDSGCVSVIRQQTIRVNPLPQVAFNLPIVCLPDGNGVFTDQSTITDNSQPLFSYRWNFNDPNDPTPSTLKNPSHRYAAVGPYPVQLIITSKDGCIDSLTRLMNTIYPQPSAQFDISSNEVCREGTLQFTDKSISTSGAVTQWRWFMGSNDSSFVKNPSKQFNDSGSYTIRLFIYDDKGCVSDTNSQEVVVHPYPIVQMANNLRVLEGGTIKIKPFYFGSQLEYDWTPALYLDSADIAQPSSTPPDDITYRLTLTGIGGCSVSDTVFIKVLKSPLVPNAFSPNGDGINDTWRIQYLESYPGATIEVFNRYGQKVFESTGYTTEWDGYFNGSLLPVGTYYYIINPRNGRKTIAGSVTIVR
jgi:gliding motility-associated-like protein